MRLQTALRLIYPPQCMTCSALVEDDGALCGACWGKMTFLDGTGCAGCGLPHHGTVDAQLLSEQMLCDDCMASQWPWDRGYSALLYEGTARRLVLSLKHGDRTELARPAAKWMARVLPKLDSDTCVVPVPLHWFRFMRRRYNQAALLARHLTNELGVEFLPDALQRKTATRSLDAKSPDQRFEAIGASIHLNPKSASQLKGRPVLLVDDVMTSGATFSACAHALRGASPSRIDVIALARVAKDRQKA